MSKPAISKLQTEMSINLTKSDLIDMIVSDKEEALEKESELLKKEKVETHKTLEKLADQHEEELIKSLNHCLVTG